MGQNLMATDLGKMRPPFKRLFRVTGGLGGFDPLPYVFFCCFFLRDCWPFSSLRTFGGSFGLFFGGANLKQVQGSFARRAAERTECLVILLQW